MAQFLIFETPGRMELPAITLMGASVKTGSNPIGKYGTGLKYSIACIVRWGGNLKIHIGLAAWVFVKHRETFRSLPIERIAMIRDRGKLLPPASELLPYTTEYGKYWQPWMVVRELEANTRDENGRSYLSDSPPQPALDKTFIVIDCPQVIDAYRKLDEIFLPNAQQRGEGVQVIEEPSKILYWRGMRVLDLEKPAQRTYNLLDDVMLTEDRTLYGEWQAERPVAIWVTQKADIPQIKSFITAKEDVWEKRVSLDSAYEPSEAFHETMALFPKDVNKTVHSYYGSWAPKTSEFYRERPRLLQDDHPFPWKVDGYSIVDRAGRTIFDAPSGYSGNWVETARKLCQRVNPGEAF